MSLWRQHLGRVPEPVWEKIGLQTLVLAENDLTDIFRLHGCGSCACSIWNTTALAKLANSELREFLYLHDNCLLELPIELARLTKLRYLNISENAFENFQMWYGGLGLEELRLLDLRANLLTELPEGVRRLSLLEKLDLR